MILKKGRDTRLHLALTTWCSIALMSHFQKKRNPTLIGRRKKLDISKDGDHICTAHLDAKDRLVKFNQLSVQNFYAPLGEELHVSSAIDVDATANSTEKQMDINIAHQQWGHCGEAMLRRTAKSQYIELFGNMQFCESCILTKSNQLAKKRSSKMNVQCVLDVVQVDLQGPFPLTAIDGTNIVES